MSQTQYLKMLEKEIQKINKKIDLKILQGEKYFKEARDHKLLLKKSAITQGGVLQIDFGFIFSERYFKRQ